MARTATRGRTEFAKRMIAAREHKQLTQHQACDALQISQGTLSSLETVSQGSIILPSFARLYGVSVDWLYDGTGEMVLAAGSEEAESRLSQGALHIAQAFDSIQDPELKRKVYAICVMVIERGDLPAQPTKQSARLARKSMAPATPIMPKHSPISGKQDKLRATHATKQRAAKKKAP